MAETMLAVRLAPIKHGDNLHPDSAAKMDLKTTSSEAFTGQRGTPAQPIKPKQSDGMGGKNYPMRTEQREAFTPKKMERAKPFKLKDNSIMTGSFEGSSGYKDEFVPRSAEVTKSFAPSYEYRKPSSKFGNRTTNQSDFIPHPNNVRLPKVLQRPNDWYADNKSGSSLSVKDAGSTYKHDFPQISKGERMSYQPPKSTLKLGKENVAISTNYKDDFTFKAQSKPKSYAPIPVVQPYKSKMESSTEAHDRFTGVFIPPPKSFKPTYEIDPNRPQMDMSTNYQSSFQKFMFIQPDQANAMTNRVNSEPVQTAERRQSDVKQE